MAGEDSSDVPVAEYLKVLGVLLVTEWDTLVFVYRHSANLSTVAQIARLVGYEKAEIAASLYRLEELGLLQRSRVSQGIRMYTFLKPPEPRCQALLKLMNLAQMRTGRLLLLKHLKQPRQEVRRTRNGGLRLA